MNTNLKVLKKLGFTHFFSEQYDSSDQDEIDILSENQTPLNIDLLNQLQSDFGYSLNKYEEITNAVLMNNYKLVAFDRRKDIKELFPSDRKTALRDEHMFLIAANFIHKNPKKKIIFFNGSFHSGPNGNSKGPSFYELMLRYLDKESTLNIKIDYYNNSVVSAQRFELSSMSNDIINLKCKSRTFLFSSPKSNDFDFYGFKDNQKAFPEFAKPSDSRVI